MFLTNHQFQKALLGIEGCIISDSLVSDLVEMVNADIDKDALKAELEIFSEIVKNDAGSSNSKFKIIVQCITPIKDSLTLTALLIEYILTIPISVASSERSFSKLKLIENILRTTMSDDRLNSLMICAAEKDILDNLNLSRHISISHGPQYRKRKRIYYST